jgi:peptide/nickel transport system permease protein
MSRSKALQYYIVSRLLLAPLQLLTIITIVFLLLRATPGDPADAILGGRAPEAAKEELRKQLGLNFPLWLQYLNYLGSILRFDLGTSLMSRGQNVWDIIGQYFPATVELAVCSMAVALIVGIAVGDSFSFSSWDIFRCWWALVWDYHLRTTHVLGGNAFAIDFLSPTGLVS